MKCLICLEKIDNNAYFLPCADKFHESCIMQWLNLKVTCPICRIPKFIQDQEQLDKYQKFLKDNHNNDDLIRQNIPRDDNSLALLFIRDKSVFNCNQLEKQDYNKFNQLVNQPLPSYANLRPDLYDEEDMEEAAINRYSENAGQLNMHEIDRIIYRAGSRIAHDRLYSSIINQQNNVSRYTINSSIQYIDIHTQLRSVASDIISSFRNIRQETLEESDLESETYFDQQQDQLLETNSESSESSESSAEQEFMQESADITHVLDGIDQYSQSRFEVLRSEISESSDMHADDEFESQHLVESFDNYNDNFDNISNKSNYSESAQYYEFFVNSDESQSEF